MEENKPENIENIGKKQINSSAQIAGAIIIAGIIIAGAILLKGTTVPSNIPTNNGVLATTLAPIGTGDRVIGNGNAKLTLVLYEDFQCPFCGKFFSDSEENIRNTYVKNGDVKIVYRDFAFLGPESVKAAEGARCAGDQGKFWEYHDYLYTHQNGENQGNFADPKLKSFAKDLGLNTANFNECLDSGKYAQAVADSKTEAASAGVTGTPKGFLVTQKNISDKTQNEIMKALNLTSVDSNSPISFYSTKNIVSLNGAIPWGMVKSIIDILLK